MCSVVATATLVAAMCTGCGSGGGGGSGGPSPFARTSDDSSVPFNPTPEQQHAVDKMNEYRAAANVAPFTLDGRLSAFAAEGSNELAAGGDAHGHFADAGNDIWQAGFCNDAAENQAPGWPGGDADAVIDSMLQSMMDEGPGGGHHDNIMNADLSRVGIGLVSQGGAFYFTTDFSASCR